MIALTADMRWSAQLHAANFSSPASAESFILAPSKKDGSDQNMVVLFIQPVITTPREWLITSINTHFHSRPRSVPCVSRIFPRSGRHQRVDPAGLHHGSRLLAVTLMTSDIFTRWKRSADKYLLSPSRTTFFNSSMWARTWPPSRVRWLPVCGSDWETTWTPADGQRLVRQSEP